MNKLINNKKSSISSEELSKFYNNQIKIEQDKKQSRSKIMEHQLLKVTGGKKLVISNCHK